MHPRPLLRWASIAAGTPATVCKLGGASRRTRDIASSYQRLFSYQGRRTLAYSVAMAASTRSQTPQFSAGVDEPALTRTLENLLASAPGGRWALIPGGHGLERSFKFKTFAKTWDFMTAVSLHCKLKNHHPEWSNVYNTVHIRWTTHNPKGLSAKDVELATICDGLAKDFGEIVDDVENADSSALKQAADRAIANAGDCCTPKTYT
ncbi:transcriptional coactivator/pterin dehydratase [Hypoxylon fuscum]|nr:transcriptional coactivator/pterin dehydratase [Hypoxylon fuscum]